MADIIMPQLGLTMTEGSVTTWLKKPGDRVEKGEPLFTVETDKVEMEVESTASGYLQSLLVPVGQVVSVKTVIARIGDTPEPDGSGAAPTAASDRNGSIPEAAASKIAASPRARKLAEELGVDLQQVKASKGSRIVEDDVRKYHALSKGSAPIPPPAAKDSRAGAIRKVVAERLTASFQQAPHFYLGVDVNATELVRMRTKLVDVVNQRAGVKLTYTDLFLMALAKALSEQAGVNASWRDGAIVRNSSVDVAFAAQGPETLLVPVIRNAAQLSLSEMAKHRHELTEKARAKKLALAELEGGSATLSNLGQFGMDWFQAILNPPQSVILATGRIAKRAAVVEDQVVACDMLTITIAADHRVLDGVSGARFLARVKALLEDPWVFLAT